MPRVRIKFAKEKPARFLSHLELANVFTRATRRAGLVVAYSRGFNPRPRMVFASALPVGVTSEDEYLDVVLLTKIDAPEVQARLQAQMPSGLVLKEVRLVPEKAPALMSVVNRAGYRVTAILFNEISTETLQKSAAFFLEQESVIVERRTKNEVKKTDIRPGVLQLHVGKDSGTAYWEMLVITGKQGNIRPQEPVEWMVRKNNLPVDPERVQIHRTALYVKHEHRIFSPMEYI